MSLSEPIVSMLVSIMLSKPLILSNFTGSIVMSLVLRLLSKVDDGLAKTLHDYRGPKPISVTPFIHNGRVLYGGSTVVDGEVLFRVSAIGGVGIRVLDALGQGCEIELFGVGAVIERVEVTSLTVGDLFRIRGRKFKVRFLSPVRFARRRVLRRRRVKYDFCPTMENILRSALVYWSRVIGVDDLVKAGPGLLRWSFNYVYMRDLYGRVVATRLPNSTQPQLGFVGSVEFEVRSRRESRLKQMWALLNLAEIVNVGTTRSLGFGYMRIETLE